MNETKQACPNCGYCPRCGRSAAPMYPAPYQPAPYPWWWQTTAPVIWSGTGTATTSGGQTDTTTFGGLSNQYVQTFDSVDSGKMS